MKPLLAHIYEPHRVTYPCYVQPKLNGVRALYQDGCFQSRDGLPWNPEVLRHLWEPLKSVFDPSVVLDGELYVHGWSLQKINGAITPVRNQPKEETLQVQYHVFDVVSFTKSFEDRHQHEDFAGRWYNCQMGWIVPDKVHCVVTWKVNSEAAANAFYAECVERKYEGMMYRLGDCPYTRPKQDQALIQRNDGRHWFVTPGPRAKFLSDKNNRCWHLLKRKDWQDDEFEIIGIEEGTGKQANMCGALVLKTKKGKIFKSGTGLSDGEAIAYFENPPIGRLAKIKFLVYSDEGIPMNSSIIAIL